MTDSTLERPAAETPAHAEDVERASAPPGAVTLLVVALLVVCFFPCLQWMWHIWMKSAYYSHGPIIPVLAAYIAWSRRREFLQAPLGRYSLWGAPIVLICLAMHGLATYWDVNFPQGFAMIGVIAGLTLLLWGWDRARIVAFPIIFLCFMVPVDRLLVTKLSNSLQLGSAHAAAMVPYLLGVPVQLSGTTIRIPDYTFEVAQACSGLKSTIAMSALAALFAYLVTAPMWKR
ncbi:MAG: exosortase/archaeosortase family protein, partial [Armatimonadetes bacterium]|nr:exosortase/archaeosortase family protein [Armatimonadota bacterium]